MKKYIKNYKSENEISENNNIKNNVTSCLIFKLVTQDIKLKISYLKKTMKLNFQPIKC